MIANPSSASASANHTHNRRHNPNFRRSPQSWAIRREAYRLTSGFSYESLDIGLLYDHEACLLSELSTILNELELITQRYRLKGSLSAVNFLNQSLREELQFQSWKQFTPSLKTAFFGRLRPLRFRINAKSSLSLD
jgi:hypothetical protein